MQMLNAGEDNDELRHGGIYTACSHTVLKLDYIHLRGVLRDADRQGLMHQPPPHLLQGLSMCYASQTCVTSISSLTRATEGQSGCNFRLKSLFFSLVSGLFFSQLHSLAQAHMPGEHPGASF